MKPNTTSTSCTLTNPEARLLKRWNVAIEINVEPMSAVDVRDLGAATTYRYMFANPAGDLSIARHWAAAFTLTCQALDEFLGRDKRGFCWRQLDIDGAVPHWYWSLGKEYDHYVLVTDLGVNTSVGIAKSAADPQDDLRNAISTLVNEGMRLAAFFNLEAGDPGARQ